MAKLILRSGYLDDYIALGENGQTIFETAIQIREAIRLRKQQTILDCLAIPQINDAASKIYWYAPHEGVAIQWAHASEQQRSHALHYLENCLSTTKSISRRCLSADKTAVQLFGAMLTKVFQFPGSQYVYLVDDKPVITFWGFVNTQQSTDGDALEYLRPIISSIVPEVINPEQLSELEEDEFSDPDPIIVRLSQSDIPLLTSMVALQPVQKPIKQNEDKKSSIVTLQKQKLSKFANNSLLIKALIAGIFITALQLSWPQLQKQFANMHHSDLPAALQESSESIFNNRLPLQSASVIASPPTTVAEDRSLEPVKPKVIEIKIDKNALILPADAVKIGSVAFMSGRWKANINSDSSLGSKSPFLHFRIKDNEGTMQVNLDKNMTCKADIYLGLMQSGNLLIKSRGKAKCSNGNHFQIPEITCKQGLTGAAQCAGRYADDTVVPMTLLRVGK